MSINMFFNILDYYYISMTSQELLPTYLTVFIYILHRRNCNACLLRVLPQLDYVQNIIL